MLTITWGTDLHLDHASNEVRGALMHALRASRGDVVVLTGDISVASRLAIDLQAIAETSARPVYFVLGNHDHYGSSVDDVRTLVTALGGALHWLPPAGVVPLGPDAALIGVDGWADGRAGDPLTTPLVLNDDRRIAEIAAQPTRITKLAVKRVLADADAARLDVLLGRAAAVAHRIIVATHVPPFVEVLPVRGRLAGPEWRPLLVSGATGRVLRRFAADHPGHTVLVLCGHSHVAVTEDIAPNLRCIVGGARYGVPGLQDLEV